MQHPDPTPGGEGFDPHRVYLRETMIADREDFLMEFSGWMDLLLDDAQIAPEALSPAALGLHHAYRYHGAAYNDGHALFFHNLKRNDLLEATLPAIRAGLALLPTQEYHDNFVAAEAALAANRQIWDVPRFDPYGEPYAAAKAVMADADARYGALLEVQDLEARIEAGVRALPLLMIVPEPVYQAAREAALRTASGPGAIAERVRQIEEERRAAIPHNPESFAADYLGRNAGYLELLTIGPGLHDYPGEDAQTWSVGMRTGQRSAQVVHLLRARGNYALLDHRMDEVLAAAPIREIEAMRRAKLGLPEPPPPARPRFGFRPPSFGRKR